MSRIAPSLLLFSFLLVIPQTSLAQCLTDKEKLFPDRFEESIPAGFTMQARGKYLVLGNLLSDSLGYRRSGLAYVYEQSAAGWNFLAILKPSNPADYLQFGQAVSISESGETIAVTAFGYLPGPVKSAVYIFKKPAEGWASMTETEKLLPDGGNTINTSVHFVSNDMLAVGQRYAFEGKGNVSVYGKQTGQNFTSAQIQQLSPDVPVAEFGASLDALEDLLVIGAPDYKQGPGGVYVFRRDAITQQYQREAILESSEELGATNKLGEKVMIKGNFIGSPAITYKNETINPRLFLFKKENNSMWSNSTELAQIKLVDDTRIYRGFKPNVELLDTLTIAVTTIYAASSDPSDNNLTGNFSTITLNHNDWGNSIFQSIYDEPFIKNYYGEGAYGYYSTWNGKQLIYSPSRFSDLSNNFSAITSFTRSNNMWGSKVKIKLPHVNSNLAWFGYAVKRHEGVLFVTSPNDNKSGNQSGAVYIHAPGSDNKWKNISKVIPPGKTDKLYGSISAWGNEFVAGGNNNQLFIYKRTTSDWSSVQLKQTIKIPADLSLIDAGYQVAMSDNVLVATAFNGGIISGTNNSIVIYKKENEAWNFKQVFNFGNAWLKSQTASVLVKGDSILVFSGPGGYAGNGTGVFLLTPQNNEWKIITSFLVPDEISILTMNLEWKENHVFVGSPTTEVNGKPNVGAVVVFSKLPGTSWPVGPVYHSAIIYPPDITENKYFGHSVSNVKNALAIGAPGAYYNTNFTIREIPGDTHIIVSKDYGWTNTYEYLRFQGDSYSAGRKDRMGFSVASDENEFFLGAVLETNERGTEAGAVYTIPTPPLVKLMPPVCNSYPRQELVGYPLGGTWSGPGVVESDKFYVQPGLLSPGKYELTYKSPNCAFEGKLEFEILQGPEAAIITPLEVSICPQNPFAIEVNQLPLAIYRWYFKSPNSTSFILVAGQNQSSLKVALAGAYYTEVSTGYCMTQSAVTIVRYESPTASIVPQPVVCDKTKQITLSASPAGGQWGGVGIANNQTGVFNPVNLANGKYGVSYTFVSASGCYYTLRDTVLIDAIPKITIIRKQEDYCRTGLARVEVTPNQNGWKYQWLFGNNNEWNTIDDISLPERTFVLAGDYKTVVSNKYCSGESNTITIGFEKDLVLAVLPAENPIQVCNAGTLQLSVQVRDGAAVEWFWRSSSNDELVKSGDGLAFEANKDGTYYAKATFGFCESILLEKQLTFIEKDTIIIPNVFTPNGDGHNEFFDVAENRTEYVLKIFNRFGQEVYKTENHKKPWRGEEHPTGVYFWLVQYTGCEKIEKQMKGYVQLVR